MAVFRIHKTRNYTVMSNHHLRDRELSYKAKGLMSVILSLPEDWEYNIAGLAALSKDGKTAVSSALAELADAGYVTITKHYPTKGNGRITYVYDIFETPDKAQETRSCEQGLEEQQLEIQGLGNITLLNTKELSTEELSTKEPSTEKPKKERVGKKTFDDIIAERTDDPELREALGEFIRMRARIKKPLTDYALKLRLNKLWDLGATDRERIEIVNQSVGACWQDFFPLKEQDGGARNAEYVRYTN